MISTPLNYQNMKFLIIFILKLILFLSVYALSGNIKETDFELYTLKNAPNYPIVFSTDSLLKSHAFRKENRHILIDRKNTKPLFVAIKLSKNVKLGTYYLVIEDCFIDNITFIKKEGNITTGALFPFASREIPFQYPTFSIEKKHSSEEVFLLKFQNFYHNSVIPFKIYSAYEFQSYTIKSYLYWGIYLGVLLITLFISLWMYLANKEQIFGFVAATIFSGIGWVLFNNGLGFQFIWPNFPKAMESGRFLFYQLAYFFLLICFQQFINLKLEKSFEKNLLKTIKFLLLISISLSFNPFNLTNENKLLVIYILYTNSLLIFISIFIVFYLIKEIKNHNLNAWFYFISIIMIFIGTFGLTLMKYEIIQPMDYILQLNYAGILIHVLTLIIGLMRQYFLQKKAKTQLELSLLKAKADERHRIALDMHDELGASLSTIRLISELGIKQKNNPKIGETLELIHHKSIQINKKLKEIIWTLQPANDSLESVLTYIFENNLIFFKEINIPFKMNLPSYIPNYSLEGIKRRHLILLLKEIFQNIAKHSKSKLTEVHIEIKDQRLEISIQDNGIGLSADFSEGNGMKNMRERVHYLKGKLISKNEEGLTYELIIPL